MRSKGYDVVFIGELHDHIANHLAEMALLKALQARMPAIALSMEQFERDVQPVVDDYLAGRIGEESLKSKGRAWRNYAEAYRPLVEYAKATWPAGDRGERARRAWCAVSRRRRYGLPVDLAGQRARIGPPPRFTPRTVPTSRNSWPSSAATRRMPAMATRQKRRKTVLRRK